MIEPRFALEVSEDYTRGTISYGSTHTINDILGIETIIALVIDVSANLTDENINRLLRKEELGSIILSLGNNNTCIRIPHYCVISVSISKSNNITVYGDPKYLCIQSSDNVRVVSDSIRQARILISSVTFTSNVIEYIYCFMSQVTVNAFHLVKIHANRSVLNLLCRYTDEIKSERSTVERMSYVRDNIAYYVTKNPSPHSSQTVIMNQVATFDTYRPLQVFTNAIPLDYTIDICIHDNPEYLTFHGYSSITKELVMELADSVISTKYNTYKHPVDTMQVDTNIDVITAPIVTSSNELSGIHTRKRARNHKRSKKTNKYK